MYLLLKSLHIISFVAWMAGLLYLPRLFVYHSEEKYNTKTYNTFLLMEKRLLKFIMNPAMLATWVSGISLYLPGKSSQHRGKTHRKTKKS